MTTPHKWADEIHAWANGNTIQWRISDAYQWKDISSESVDWNAGEFRIKPEPEYPKSNLSDGEIFEIVTIDPGAGRINMDLLRYLANESIKRAIQDGQVAIVERAP